MNQNIQRGKKKVQIKNVARTAAHYAYMAKIVTDVKRDFAAGTVSQQTLTKFIA